MRNGDFSAKDINPIYDPTSLFTDAQGQTQRSQFNFGGKSIVGTLNGGGVDIKLTSMNGTITIRDTK